VRAIPGPVPPQHSRVGSFGPRGALLCLHARPRSHGRTGGDITRPLRASPDKGSSGERGRGGGSGGGGGGDGGGGNVRGGVLCTQELRDGDVEEERETRVEMLFAERDDWLCEAQGSASKFDLSRSYSLFPGRKLEQVSFHSLFLFLYISLSPTHPKMNN